MVYTANLPTNIMDFRGFDPSIIIVLMGGILTSKGDFPESLSQAMLVGVMMYVCVCIYIYIYIYI